MDGQYSLVRELVPDKDGSLLMAKTFYAGNQQGQQGFQGCIGKFHYNSFEMELRLDENGAGGAADGAGGGNELMAQRGEPADGTEEDNNRFRPNRAHHFYRLHRQRREGGTSGSAIVQLEAIRGVVQGCSQVECDQS